MNTTRFICFCGQSLEIDCSMNGKQIFCPVCQQQLIVPGDPPLNKPIIRINLPQSLPTIQQSAQPSITTTIQQTYKHWKVVRFVIELLLIVGLSFLWWLTK